MKLNIRVSRKAGSQSLTKQITTQLGNLIDTGALAVHSVIPSERTLADAVGVARNVVRHSYEYLLQSGHIERDGARGRRVKAKRRATAASSKAQAALGAKNKTNRGKSAQAKSASGKQKAPRRASRATAKKRA
jgi:DNA-binding GntR family transcriptional regulator